MVDAQWQLNSWLEQKTARGGGRLTTCTVRDNHGALEIWTVTCLHYYTYLLKWTESGCTKIRTGLRHRRAGLFEGPCEVPPPAAQRYLETRSFTAAYHNFVLLKLLSPYITFYRCNAQNADAQRVYWEKGRNGPQLDLWNRAPRGKAERGWVGEEGRKQRGKGRRRGVEATFPQ